MEDKSYTTIASEAHIEFEEKRSRFIGHAKPCSTEEEAIAFVNEIRSIYPDATHNVYAYYLRVNGTTRYSDDHEPQGTAGLPVLDVIRKSGYVDVALVVTRYFGGTLLGTGGLVRAYTKGAKDALEAAGKKTYETLTPIEIICNYSDYQKILNVISFRDVTVEKTDFFADVTLSLLIRYNLADDLLTVITDTCGGRPVLRRGKDFFGCI